MVYGFKIVVLDVGLGLLADLGYQNGKVPKCPGL